MLREAVLSHDTTRPITQAICSDWGNVLRNWDRLSDIAFRHLDIGGYNYLPEHYETDHARNPQRVMMATESYPKDFFDYWSLVEKHPYIIGDFVWTAMDYFGESGIGHSTLSNEKDSFLMPWRWFNAWCGDIDACVLRSRSPIIATWSGVAVRLKWPFTRRCRTEFLSASVVGVGRTRRG